jgi:curved DNA-binding protein CbpA
MSNWERVQKAYKILSDPALRALYDGGRLYSLAVRSKQKSKGKGKARMKFAKRSTRNFVKGKDGYHQRHRIELKREEMDA